MVPVFQKRKASSATLPILPIKLLNLSFCFKFFPIFNNDFWSYKVYCEEALWNGFKQLRLRNMGMDIVAC